VFGKAVGRVLQAGDDTRAVKDRLVIVDLATTMNYTHVLKLGVVAVRSPVDALAP